MKLNKNQKQALKLLEELVSDFGYYSLEVLTFNSMISEPDKSIINNIILGIK